MKLQVNYNYKLMKNNTLALLLITILSIFLFSACKDKKVNEVKATKTVEIPKETPKSTVKEEPRPITQPKQIIRKIIVKEGEWLYNISRREYGNAQGWIKIYNANKAQINNPDLIYPNQELIIPD
jgi:nucleoid-associated protein YgaU